MQSIDDCPKSFPNLVQFAALRSENKWSALYENCVWSLMQISWSKQINSKWKISSCTGILKWLLTDSLVVFMLHIHYVIPSFINIVLCLILISVCVQGMPAYIVFFSPSIVQFSHSALVQSGCLQPSTQASSYHCIATYKLTDIICDWFISWFGWAYHISWYKMLCVCLSGC